MKKYWISLVLALAVAAVPVTLANGMMYHGWGMMGWPAQGYGPWGPWAGYGQPAEEPWEMHGCPMMGYYGWPAMGPWMGYWGPWMGMYPTFNQTVQQPEPTGVAIRGFSYNPQVIVVQKGTTVTWTNFDAVEHTITFEGGLADSGPLAYGQSFSYTFNEEGKYYYSCRLHPYMIGAVIVEG